MKTYSRVCADINLNAIESNLISMKNNISENTQMIAVIKTDGYGHGACQIADFIENKPFLWGFAVATLDEGVLLRKRGIKKPILVLGCIFPDQMETAILEEIRLTVYTLNMARQISEVAVKLGKQAFCHLKIDTGMSRLGFPLSDDSLEDMVRLFQCEHIVLEGIFTHFAKADEKEKSYTKQQMDSFRKVITSLEERSVNIQYHHCSNSAGIIDIDEANMDIVRAGISLYGLYPSDEVMKDRVPLVPALSLISHVAHVKEVNAGIPVSYGGTFVTEKKTVLATIPVGYGDGYPRSLSNQGYVLIRGKKAPICGRICMDQFMVDVTDIAGVSFADRVTLIGRDGDEEITVDQLAQLSGRFNYEFVCDLGKRIPRNFYVNGTLTEQSDAF